MITHTHTINGHAFIIEEFEPGSWFWTNGEGESKRPLANQAEALQDAMRWVREREEEERERVEPDSYRVEQSQFFNLRDYQ